MFPLGIDMFPGASSGPTVTGYPLTDIGWYLLKNRPYASLLLQLYLLVKVLFAELKGDKDYCMGGRVINLELCRLDSDRVSSIA